MRRAPLLLFAAALVITSGVFLATCHYVAPWWDECCECECEGCDPVPERIFAPTNDLVECWEECDDACGRLGECGAAVTVGGCAEELCVEYVQLGEECDGALAQSEAPVDICRYYFRECEHPDWACSGGICVES